MRIVVLMQENKTPDFYFPTLASWGANIQNRGNLLSSAPVADPRHDRDAWVHYRMGDYAPPAVQIDNDALLPYYSWLAKQFTYCDYHFGLGTNSTPGHLLAVGGQTPTLRNPPSGTSPVWDLPTVFKHVESGGRTWGAFTGSDLYPVKFYQELGNPASRANIHTSTQPADDAFTAMAAAGKLPDFCFVWSPSGYDEHPPDQSVNPQYLTAGHDLTWQRVDAVVRGGGWSDTVFILTWDDWGGYADHVATPNSETVKDALHPAGFQLLGGSRIPMIVFGGHVTRGIDNRWHSHAVIVKTAIDVFGLKPFGIARVDGSASLAARIDTTALRAPPPALGGTIVQPAPPHPAPPVLAPQPWTGPVGKPLPALTANGGKTLPAPDDAVVSAHPPKSP